MRIPRVHPKDATALIDKAVGLGKEIVGEFVDNASLIKAGEAQQSKGSEKLKAIRAQAKADGHRLKAAVQEQKQQAAER